jgi:hypothetical protein
MRKENPTMAMYPSFFPSALPLMNAMVANALDIRDRPGLVPLGNCPNVPGPCGHCAYCRARTDGPEWWLQNG